MTSRERNAMRLLAGIITVAIALTQNTATPAPKNFGHNELDYRQPVVKPGKNKNHKRSKGEAVTTAAATAAATCANPIACENLKTGTPDTEWGNFLEPGDASIQGYATSSSVNLGQTIRFKIKSSAAYHIDILRAGWYQGNGARKLTRIPLTGSIAPQTQPACLVDSSKTTGLIDCGNWAESAHWDVPGLGGDAVSGIYFARLVREDTGGSSYIFFVVRNNGSTSEMIYQMSDTTNGGAYNPYGGNDLYNCAVSCPPPGQISASAYKTSFNKPNIAAQYGMNHSFFGAEFMLVEFLEANGYDVTYISGIDTDRSPSLLSNHKVFISSGHDEYWSGQQRANVEAARDAGLHLAFFGANVVYWKTRYEPSIDGTNTDYRTLVCYKETHFDKVVDPKDPTIWTGTWRDARYSPPGDGGRPENALTGTIYTVDPPADFPIQVPAADGKMRFWRNTAIASQTAGQTWTLPRNTLGYEWDEDLDNGARPPGIIHLSTTTQVPPFRLMDMGNTYYKAAATHHATLYRAASGALVFSAGTVQWSWGLEGSPDGTTAVDLNMEQATVNLFADMGVQPTTLISGLVAASASTDTTAPQSVITSPAAGASFVAGSTVFITGTAADSGGGRVGGVEVSTNGGATWHPASGSRENWTYQWIPLGPTLDSVTTTIRSRAVDDSANLEAPSSGVPVTITKCTSGCTIWPSTAAPMITDDGDSTSGSVGVKFRSSSDGVITGIRFFKFSGNSGTHVGNIWSANGVLLASATFTGESASGWQQATFSPPVSITAGSTYVASYHSNAGHYSQDFYYFFSGGFNNPPLRALQDGEDGPNGPYSTGTSILFPTFSYISSNYWVDVVFTPSSSGGDTPPTVVSETPAPNATGVAASTSVTAKFSEDVQPSTIIFTLKDPSGNSVAAGTPTYDSTTFTVTLKPTAVLTGSTKYTASVSGAKDSANIQMTAPVNWSFTTAAATATPDCPCYIWPDVTPSVIDDRETIASTLGVRFRSDLDGYIAGIQFYKARANTGTHVGSLWTNDGQLLAQATFTNESASGWQEVRFPSPVAIKANTTYLASYHSNTGHFSVDVGYFATKGVDNAPIHALQDGIDGSNGAFHDSSSIAFPDDTYQSTNYWVDVVFVTDSTPPTVISRSPATNATGVARNTSVKATFSEAVQASTIVFTLKNPSGATVAATVTYSNNIATLKPSSGLARNTKYTATVSGAKDLSGNAMTAPVTWSFTTLN